MVASLTTLPVIGVPVKTAAMNGVDSLLSIVQVCYETRYLSHIYTSFKSYFCIVFAILSLRMPRLS